jgi:hypothetical protein
MSTLSSLGLLSSLLGLLINLLGLVLLCFDLTNMIIIYNLCIHESVSELLSKGKYYSQEIFDYILIILPVEPPNC